MAQIENIQSSLDQASVHQVNFSNQQKLEKIAQDLLDQAGLAGRFYPKERDFVMAASRLVVKIIENFYSPSGGQPPALSTVRAWFYRDCPDWAIAVLANQAQQK